MATSSARASTSLGADLSGLDLSGIDLGRATIGQTNVAGTKLATTNLVGTQIYMLTGVPASLPPGSKIVNGGWLGPGASLIDASLMGLNLSGIDFSHADLRGADLTGATGNPTGGSTAAYEATTCPDGTKATTPATCVGHGFAS